MSCPRDTVLPCKQLMVSTSLQDMRKDNLGVEAMGRKLAEEVHAHIMRSVATACTKLFSTYKCKRGAYRVPRANVSRFDCSVA